MTVDRKGNSDLDLEMNDNHLRLFDALVRVFADRLGVSKRWTVATAMDDEDDSDKYAASVALMPSGRLATVYLSKRQASYPWPMNARLLAEFAAHEVAHIVTGPLMHLAEDGAPGIVDVDAVEHEVINTIVSLLRPEFSDVLEPLSDLERRAFPDPDEDPT